MTSKTKKKEAKPPPILVEPPADLLAAARRLPVYVNDGLGVESQAVFERWVNEPESRFFNLGGHRIPFHWDQVTMLTAQTGGEDPLTSYLITNFKLPRYRELGIRYVQVARAGPREEDGIVILSDTTEPDELFTEGAYKLSDELLVSGTVPAYAGGKHICSQKFKKFCCETFINFDLNEPKICPYPQGNGAEQTSAAGVPPVLRVFNYNADEQTRIRESDSAIRDFNTGSCALVFGYNSGEQRRIRESDAALDKINDHYFFLVFGFNKDEQKRLTEAKTYDIAPRVGVYPLELWGWNREQCLDYIQKTLGVRWTRSRCSWCPFNSLTQDDIERFRLYPVELYNALVIEYIALAMNPRATLYRNRSLHEIAVEHKMQEGLRMFEEHITTCVHSLYRIRRIYNAKGGDPKKKGLANRCVEKLDTGTRSRMQAAFQKKAKGLLVERQRLHVYAYARHPSPDTYPTAEEYYVVCPNTVETKAHYGVEWFDDKWYRTVGFDPTRTSAGQLGLSF